MYSCPPEVDDSIAPVSSLRCFPESPISSERTGESRSGRVYHLTVTAQDLAGNAVTGTADCTVPHDRVKEK